MEINNIKVLLPVAVNYDDNQTMLVYIDPVTKTVMFGENVVNEAELSKIIISMYNKQGKQVFVPDVPKNNFELSYKK